MILEINNHLKESNGYSFLEVAILSAKLFSDNTKNIEENLELFIFIDLMIESFSYNIFNDTTNFKVYEKLK